MKTLLSILFFLFTALLFAEKIWIVNTTDLHGKIFASDKHADMRKLTSAVRREIQGKNPLRIDCGDLILGSLESALDKGFLAVSLLNELRYDVWVPGNHDFEFGREVLQQRFSEFKGTPLAANLKLNGKPCASWKIFERSGVRIAVIGMTNSLLDNWIFNCGQDGIETSGILQSLARVMPEVVREKPDLIVLAMHSGKFTGKRFQNKFSAYAVARMYPAIDLILGGHSHEYKPGETLPPDTWFVQAGRYSDGFALIEIDFDRASRKRTVSSRLIRVESTEKPWEPAPEYTKPLKRKMFEKVCRNAPAFGGKQREQALSAEFSDAIRRAVPVEIVFHGALTRTEKKAGVLTRKDVFDLCPFENTVVIALITQSECRAILNEQKTQGPRFKMKQYEFGVSMEKNGTLRRRDGSVWSDENQRLPVAFNSYSAAGAGCRFPVLKKILGNRETAAKDSGKKVRDLLEDNLRRKYQ